MFYVNSSFVCRQMQRWRQAAAYSRRVEVRGRRRRRKGEGVRGQELGRRNVRRRRKRRLVERREYPPPVKAVKVCRGCWDLHWTALL